MCQRIPQLFWGNDLWKEENFEFVFHIPLTQLCSFKPTIDSFYEIVLNAIPKKIEKEILKERDESILWIFDGLDELDIICNSDDVTRSDVAKYFRNMIIDQEILVFKNVIITTRPEVSLKPSPLSLNLEINGLNEKSKHMFVKKYFQNDQNKISIIEKILKRNQALSSSMKIPIYLNILCYLVDNDKFSEKNNTDNSSKIDLNSSSLLNSSTPLNSSTLLNSSQLSIFSQLSNSSSHELLLKENENIKIGKILDVIIHTSIEKNSNKHKNENYSYFFEKMNKVWKKSALKEEIKKILSMLSFYTFHHNQFYIEIQKIEEILEYYFSSPEKFDILSFIENEKQTTTLNSKKKFHSDMKKYSAINFILKTILAGGMIRKIGESFHFLHFLIQEYLTSFYVVKQLSQNFSTNQIYEKYFNWIKCEMEKWFETSSIPLFIGFLLRSTDQSILLQVLKLFFSKYSHEKYEYKKHDQICKKIE